jgi:hypothetical protein
VADATDNCPHHGNGEQTDTDGDGLGNPCDPDDDGDNLADTEEAARATDPLRADTDGDGVADGLEVSQGSDPLDPNESSPPPADPSTAFEPNDTLGQAAAAAVGDRLHAAIGQAGDVDYFRFAATAGQYLVARVVADGPASPLDADLHLYGPDHRPIVWSDDREGLDPGIALFLTATGTHRLAVGDVRDLGGAAYTYHLDLTATDLHAREPDDTAAQASWTGVDTEIPAALTADDVDHYRFQARAGEALVVEVSAASVGSALRPALHLAQAASGLELSAPASGDPRLAAVIPGTGPVVVAVAGSGTGHYLLTVRRDYVGDDGEPNGLVEQATPLALDDPAFGLIGHDTDADFFRVQVAAGQRLTFDVDAEVDGSELDPTLTLVDRDGTTVIATVDDTDGLDPRLTHTFAAAGTYYLKVTDLFQEGGDDFYYALLAE